MIKISSIRKLAAVFACGAVVFQGTGGCSLTDALLPTVLNVGLGVLLSSLFGVPIL